MALQDFLEAGLNTLKAGFSLAVPISGELRQKIEAGVLVHRVSVDIAKKHVILGRASDGTGFPNARIRLTGKTGDGLLHLMRATLRDHRVVDPSVFQGAAERGFTDFVYFGLLKRICGRCRVRAVCQVHGRGRFPSPRRCGSRRIFAWSVWPCC